ncbi:heterokaryon incompatibility protein-domain-containing protein, partial [Rhypophila decipiens]
FLPRLISAGMSSSMSCDQFKYAPFDLATDAIRLVRLLKGSDYDLIICELFETFLHQVDGTPYEALSYTWGQSQELIQITLCGKRVLVRDNLFTALWHLRKPDEDRLLWIDAICIDQQSHLEKGHQVGQMRLIYLNAQHVHVWLGQSTDDIDMLMNHMNQLDKRALRRPEYRRNSSAAWENEWPILRAGLDRLGTNNSNFHVRRCAAAMDLLERPWFRRVWIIQEVFNAKIATVGCGLNSLPTRTFVLIPKLLGLEQKVASCEATDLRDKVYALVGISSDAGTDGKLQPDYDTAVTMETVLHRTLSYLVFGRWMKELLKGPAGLGDFAVLKQALDLLEPFQGPSFEQALSSALLLASSKSNIACIEVLLDKVASGPGRQAIFGSRDPLERRTTPLHVVAEHATFNVDKVALMLLNAGVQVSTKDDTGRSALWIAAYYGGTELIRLFLGWGADVNDVNDLGQSLLWIASDQGDREVVELLVERGAWLHQHDEQRGWTPLFAAAFERHE